MMKCFVALCFVTAVLGVPAPPITSFYHDAVGIPAAARIKAAEEAVDFDGARITGGSAANLGVYPHMGGLVITLSTGATSVCGSSLLTNNRLLTAAHCWLDGRNQARAILVVLGSIRLFSGGTRVNAYGINLHGGWNPSTAANDIAVIHIPWVGYSSVVNRINLPSGNQLSNDFAGTWAIAAGYGATSDSSGITNNQFLSHVNLRVITNAECQQTFGGVITGSHLCTSGEGGRSVCGGDSGGPLQIGGPTLIGVASFVSSNGCTRGFPAAFTRVTSHIQFILSSL